MTATLWFAAGCAVGFLVAVILASGAAARYAAGQIADLEASAFGADLPDALERHGYRVHRDGRDWWWTWTVDGVADVTAGPNMPTQYRAWADALAHYLAHSQPDT